MSFHKFEKISKHVRLYHGDCLDVLPMLVENSIDSCVTDPPYHINFMGKKWDGGDIAFRPETWAQVLRVLKPGGHLAAFGAPKNYHRLACAIEDAGFEIRDSLLWLYGSGFPKSHDVSKGIDKAAGAEREVVGRKADPRYLSPADAASGSPMGNISPRINGGVNYERAGFVTAPATDLAAKWQGWGSALKPSYEPIILARKPIIGTIAANVLEWGTGGLNIDGCRIGVSPDDRNHAGPSVPYKNGIALPTGNSKGRPVENLNLCGRWPANVCHDGSDEVVGMFPETGISSGGRVADSKMFAMRAAEPESPKPVSISSCARFFYTAKANGYDRDGSAHPTVKGVSLIQWLMRLVTPPDGIVLDMFAGSGTAAVAAELERFNAILVEKEADYCGDIRGRFRDGVLKLPRRVKRAPKIKKVMPGRFF